MSSSKTGSIKRRITDTGKRLARNLHTLQIMKPAKNEEDSSIGQWFDRNALFYMLHQESIVTVRSTSTLLFLISNLRT